MSQGPSGPKKVLVGDKLQDGADVRPATFKDAIKTIRPGDLLKVGSNECANRGLTNGLAVGSGVALFRMIVLKGLPMSGANWGVAAGLASSIVSHQLCRYVMQKEKQVMRRTVEIYHDAKLQKKAAQEVAAGGAEAAEATTAKPAPETPAKRSWYKAW